MSKTPLQLYINEKYDDAVSGYVNKDCYHPEKSQRHRSDTFGGRQQTFKQLLHSYTNSDFCFGSQTIFKNYLREHKKSIEDYYNLQKQQKEILRLCKEKIAKKFPAQLVANLADEDVIRALKIAQNSDNQMEKCCSSDQIVDAILKFITSSEEQKQMKKRTSSQNSNGTAKRKTQRQTTIKGNSGFRKFLGVFRKNKSRPDKIYPKQECTYIMDTQKCESTKCPSRPANKSRYVKNKSATSDSAFDTDSSVTPNISNTKVDYKSDLIKRKTSQAAPQKLPKTAPVNETDKCRCHSRVKKITSDIRRQENQIKAIQCTLQDCLTILKRIDHPCPVYKHDIIDKSINSDKKSTPDLNMQGRTHCYRVDTGKGKKVKKKKKVKQRKSDASADSHKKVCCYKCKKKQKKSDKTISASPDKQNTATSTSAVSKSKSKTPPSTPKPTKTKTSSVTTDQTSLVTDDDDDDSLPLTKKERRKRQKRHKLEMKREKKRQKQLAKSQPQKKRCCLIRLIKFVCCSGCCT